MTVPATYLIDGLASAKAPIGANNGIGTGDSSFAVYVAAAQANPAGGGKPQTVPGESSVATDALAIDGLDAALIPATIVPTATAAATPGFIGLVSGGATFTPPGLTGAAPALGAALPNSVSQAGTPPSANILGAAGLGIDFGDTVSGLAAGARAAAGGPTVPVGANAGTLPNTAAGDPAANLVQVPSSTSQSKFLTAPGGAANQAGGTGLAAGPETSAPTGAAGTAIVSGADISTTVPSPAIPVTVSKIAQAARPLPRPALAGNVAIAVTEATPTPQAYGAISPNPGGAAAAQFGAKAALHAGVPAGVQPGDAGIAATVLGAPIDGGQTGGRSAEALNGALEHIAPATGSGEIRADGSQPIVQHTTLTSSHPADTVIRAEREAPAPQQPPAEQVALQLRNAVRNGIDRISIQLKPATLGTIDVRLDIGHDGRVLAVIAADKTDTLDLLQRDARGLEKALQDAGLRTDSGSLSFNLRGEGGYARDRSDAPGGDETAPGGSTAEGEAEPAEPAQQTLASNRALDIRI